MTRITDPETGLSFTLPTGWRQLHLPDIPLAAVPQTEDPIFTSSLIATVSRAGGRTLDDIAVEASAEWLDVTPSGLVVDGYEVESPAGPAELRMIHSLYSVGITSVALSSLLVLSGDLVTRVDLSTQAVDAEDAVTVLYDTFMSLTAPTAAPAARPPGSAQELQERLQDGGGTIA